MRERTKILVSLGDCAVTANVPGMRNAFGVEGGLRPGVSRERDVRPGNPGPGGAAAATTAASWGTRLLNMVLVASNSATPQPTSWLDLNSGAYDGKIAIPDPGFAGSAFAALGYFGTTPAYGLDYYRSLRQHGTVQVSAIGDVITGVAKGQYLVGMALDKSIRDEVTKGSPIKLVWPKEGAIAIYSPIAVFGSSADIPASEALVNFILSTDGQTQIAGTGWQPIRSDVPWTLSGGTTLQPDWTTIFAQQDQLLKDYRTIFGG